MRRDRIDVLLLSGALGLCIAGIVDAARDHTFDLLVLYALAVALLAALILRAPRGRSLVAVRADLARWLKRRAAVTGERTEDLTDRAVATYRAGLGDDDDDDT